MNNQTRDFDQDDECETCGGDGQVNAAENEPVDYKVMADCSDCTDDERYSETRPEDEEWLEDLRQSVCGGLSGDDKERLGFYGMTIEDIVLTLAEHIDDLEQELQNCWENQQEYKNDLAELNRQNAELREQLHKVREEMIHRGKLGAKWKRQRDNLQERIEEARITLNQGDVERAKEILSPDSDEENYFSEKG